MRTIILSFIFSLNVFVARAATDDSLTMTKIGCQNFTKRLSEMKGLTSGNYLVPKYHSHPYGKKIPIFWWKREGTNKSAPPLVFIHGGVAGNSWALLDKWPTVIRNYPGDFISLDLRGEGCSKELSSNLLPSEYRHLSVRNVVKDLEMLRTQLWGYAKWRIVGHSRGSAIVHYYLEMAPQGLESAHAMGYSIAASEFQSLNTLVRAQGFYSTAQTYLKLYPEDEERVRLIRSRIKPETCWLGLDDRKICGPSALDVFANYLSRRSSWKDLHSTLTSMIDFDSTYAAIQKRLPNDVYGHFNYIISTNGQTFGNPDSVMTELLKSNPIYTDSFLSEIRFIVNAISPSVQVPWRASVDSINYDRIKRFLTSNPNFKYYLYSGALDPIAPPMAFKWETDFLGSLVNFVNLPDSAHDGWFDPILLSNIVQISP